MEWAYRQVRHKKIFNSIGIGYVAFLNFTIDYKFLKNFGWNDGITVRIVCLVAIFVLYFKIYF
jgi:hypothetical protein